VPSIGTVGNSYDNALAESLTGLYKAECVRHEGPVRTVDDLELRTLTWVHWFNRTRLHSAQGHVPPVEFEQAHSSCCSMEALALSGTGMRPSGVGCRARSLPSLVSSISYGIRQTRPSRAL
jgi:hypothetical protein